jgi:protein TonB
MAREFMGDVLRPSDAAGRRRRLSIVPLSIAAHGAAALAFLIVPLTAEVELPAPIRPLPNFVEAIAVPPPPAPAPPRGTRTAVTRAPAPTQAPPEIAAEPPDAPVSGPVGPVVPGAIGIPNGIADVGAVAMPSQVYLPEPPPPPAVHRVGGKIREPRKVHDVSPLYPPFALAARKEGTVILEALLDERGHVAQVRVLKSEPLLDAAAVEAVGRWRYTPTLLNNVPVPVLMTITVRFSLQR